MLLAVVSNNAMAAEGSYQAYICKTENDAGNGATKTESQGETMKIFLVVGTIVGVVIFSGLWTFVIYGYLLFVLGRFFYERVKNDK